MIHKTRLFTLLAAALVLPAALANVATGEPDPSPPGFEQWVSPVITPSPVVGAGDWANAVAKAKKFVAGLTLEEKINVTTGIDLAGRCVGNTGVCRISSLPFLASVSLCTDLSRCHVDDPSSGLERPLPPRLASWCPFGSVCQRIPSWDQRGCDLGPQSHASAWQGDGRRVPRQRSECRAWTDDEYGCVCVLFLFTLFLPLKSRTDAPCRPSSRLGS